jgi:glycosyltransferase involved in cell wall biosynthesis
VTQHGPPFTPLRLVALGSALNGNSASACSALCELGDQVLVVLLGDALNTATEPLPPMEGLEVLYWNDKMGVAALDKRVAQFRPDAISSAGWNQPSSYRRLLKKQPSSVVRLLFMDSIWRPSLKQFIGRVVSPMLIRPLFDVVMVPGERTEFLARRLGFDASHTIRGIYSGDTPLFDRGPRTGEEIAAHRSFLFVGRLVEFKGIRLLLQAYRQYRSEVSDPWDLHIVGSGPEERLLDGVEGVIKHDFPFPAQGEVSALMHQSSCFVLPSFEEHWGLVVHEAAAAGLPLLVSDTAGVVPGLVQDGFNGWAVAEGDVDEWVWAMVRVSRLSAQRLDEMSAVSRALSTRLNPSGWARHIHEEIERCVLKARSRPNSST